MTNDNNKFLEDLDKYVNNTDKTKATKEGKVVEDVLDKNITIDEVRAIKQALLYLVVDKSASMYNNGLEDGVIKGLEDVKRVVNGSKEVESIQTAMTFFGSTLDMRPFQYGEKIDISYSADEPKTILYDAIVKSCNNMIKQYDKLENDYKLKAIMLIFTDGEENGSKEYNLEDVQVAFKQLKERNIKYLIAAYNGADLSKLCKDLRVEQHEVYKVKDDHQLRRLIAFTSKSMA